MKCAPERIRVEVVYATPHRQVIEEVTLDAPATLEQAVRATAMQRQFPSLSLATATVGVYGRERPLHWPLADGDRVEIYRPLTMSPTEVRRARAAAVAGATPRPGRRRPPGR